MNKDMRPWGFELEERIRELWRARTASATENGFSKQGWMAFIGKLENSANETTEHI